MINVSKTSKVSRRKLVLRQVGKTEEVNLFSEAQKDVTEYDYNSADEELTRLQGEVELNNFYVGKMLHIINANMWFEDEGFRSFRNYCEERHGIQYRKAMYLVKMYQELTASGVDYRKIAHLGWSKIKEIASVITIANTEEWIEIAENLNVVRLQKYVRDILREADVVRISRGIRIRQSSPSQMESIRIRVSRASYAVIEQALTQVKIDQSVDDDSIALESICLFYLYQLEWKNIANRGK